MNESMLALGKVRSVIREIFEYGLKRKREIGEENVFDFSLGNPSVAPPSSVNRGLVDLIEDTDAVALHGYTSAAGDPSVREAIAVHLNRVHGTDFSAAELYLTVGAAAALTCTLSAICNEGDEVIVCAPYFPEYRVFIERTGARVVETAADPKTFTPDPEAIRAAITDKTVAVVINSPNNPTGAVITEDELISLCEVLREKENEIGRPIYLISDEPYRELVYDGVEVPFVTKYYRNTVVCYSFSKSLSLPGERIGYVLVPKHAEDGGDLIAAVAGAGRALGFVCAPSLFQKLLPKVLGETADLSVYQYNRDLLLSHLSGLGFSVVPPKGAFYLFVKAPFGDAERFAALCREEEILVVPADSFGTAGWVRISYCVAPATVERALNAFVGVREKYKEKELYPEG